MPSETLERSLDFTVRVSDKNHYVSPTRGQLGNALKCVWAAPYVAEGESGHVEVSTGGQTHHIDITLDRIGQKPQLSHQVENDGIVKNGTLVKIHWPGIASYLTQPFAYGFYNAVSVRALVARYSSFNPHAYLLLEVRDGEGFKTDPHNARWLKWKPDNPTSPHWYTLERMKSLIAAYVADERSGGKSRTVREFVSEFAGLSGTGKQKAVTEAAQLSGLSLHDLVDGGDISTHKAAMLLTAMQKHSRKLRPSALGVLGRDFVEATMELDGIAVDSIQYQKVEGESNGLPFVLEVALGVHDD